MKRTLLFSLIFFFGLTVKAQETIDLGLSVNWGFANIGATTPEDPGAYFAWGEINEKTEYSWKTYIHSSGHEKTMTKYCVNAYYGKVDDKKQLGTSDDAAKQLLGGDWHIPTKAEFQELEEKCQWEWVEQNGKAGYRVTGPSGNSIFLPAAGNKYNATVSNLGKRGDYWTSTLGEDYSNNGVNYTFWNEGHKLASNFRYYGRTIRAVRSKDAKKKVYDETLDGMQQIDEALVKARAEGKQVVCQVGGNWCIWCLRFADFITKDEDISKLISDNYVYIHINTSPKNKNEKALARLGNQQLGYPHLVFLNAEGQIDKVMGTGEMEEGKSYSKEKVMERLAPAK